MEFETNNYKLTVEEYEGELGYVIRHKESGVTEYRDNILPRAYSAMKDIQSKHDEAFGPEEGGIKLVQ